MTKEKMIKEFMCPGCTCGSDPKTCDCYKLREVSEDSFNCEGHSAGTFILGLGRIYLGMPKGFCRHGRELDRPTTSRPGDGSSPPNLIRLWEKGKNPGYDKFNIAVWALEKDGFLFVRCFCPRINVSYVDVIESGKKSEIAPNAIDVAPFYDAMD